MKELNRTRYQGFDVARALAIFGMVVVNFKIAMNADFGNAFWLSFAGLFEGRASALFVILAGVGLSFLSDKARGSGSLELIAQTRLKIIKRALLLIIIGLLYTPIWEADILHFYGVYFFIAAALIKLSDRGLLLMAAVITAAFPLLFLGFDYEQNWNWNTLKYEHFWTFDGMVRHILFNGFHPVFPWLAFLILGMWLARQDLQSSVFKGRLALIAVGILGLCEFGSAALQDLLGSDSLTWGLSPEEVSFLFSTSVIPPMPQYVLSAASSAVLIILACLAVSERLASPRLIFCLSKTGQLSLSLYVAHVVVGMGILEALGYLENQSIEVSLFSAMVFCLTGSLFSVLWLRHFNTGPLEALFKKLST